MHDLYLGEVCIFILAKYEHLHGILNPDHQGRGKVEVVASCVVLPRGVHWRKS